MSALTLVVPTYNRPELLQRLLLHFNLDECPFPIVVADGSRPEGREANARVISEYGRDLDIVHRPYPPELGFAARCAAVLMEVETPFVALHADDDFMFAEGLSALVSRLNRDPGLVAAQGSMLMVGRRDPLVRVVPYIFEDVTDATPLARLHSHLRTYRQTLYSVHRLWSARLAFQKIAPFAEPWLRMMEIGFSGMVALNGPFRHVPVLQGVRESHAASESSNDMRWGDMVTDPRFSAVVDSYANVLAAEAAAHSQASLEPPEIAADRPAAVRRALVEFLKLALTPSSRAVTEAQLNQSWAAFDLFERRRMTAKQRRALQTIFLSLN